MLHRIVPFAKLVRLFLLLCTVCLVPGFGQDDPANPNPKIIFILDASGSMWGKVGDEAKIVSAKRVLNDSILSLPDDAEVGLIAYGHRSKGDCADIETLSGIRRIDKTGLPAKIDVLDPKGKTPITDSLRKAIDEVKSYGSDETVKIVLVSDGLETCAGDPCKLVREAKAAGVNIVVHVIGFDTASLDVSQFECIAQAGGGLFLNAADSGGLGEALEQAVAAEVSEYNNFLSVRSVVDGKLNDAMVTVKNSETGEEMEGGRTYEGEETNPRKIPLPVGTYDVTVRSIRIKGSPTITFEKVEVIADETTERLADFSAGMLKVRVTLNGELHDATVDAVSQATNEVIASGRTYTTDGKVLRVVPGKYYVQVSPLRVLGYDKFDIRDVIVNPGDKETFVEKDFAAGTLKIGTKRGAVLIDSMTTIIAADGGTVVGGSRTYTAASSNPRTYVIKPGTYKIKVAAIRPKGIPPKEITITVKKGETVERMIEY
ncbi:MAG: VWA domain-containing protein [Acidobacteria bacterium]|nr:VWA domain-containing protein [Acidobacteriota bacterium]